PGHSRPSAPCPFLLSRISSISWFHLFALFSPPPYQPVPANRESSLRQPPFPSLARADRRRLVEQPVLFLLLGQPGEFGHQRVPGWEERFLAVEDGGIGARRVVEAVELPRPERELDAAQQGRVRVGLEVGIDQVRDLPRMPVQLDQVRPLDLAQVRPGAALVNPQQHLEPPPDWSDDRVRGDFVSALVLAVWADREGPFNGPHALK